jgi:nucleoside-diphosphate-sugar epimerase
VNALVTGGAGFIGRWVVQRLLATGARVLALDDLSNGRRENLDEFERQGGFLGLKVGDLKDRALLDHLFAANVWDHVFHLGASIHVQHSIDQPETTFQNDVVGTFAILEACRGQYFRLAGLDPKQCPFLLDEVGIRLDDRRPRLTVVSTCMVYAPAVNGRAITETHSLRPASPYAACKIAADNLALSYHHAYCMPVTVVRPFNTYGPFQKANGEGGVVSVFLKRAIEGLPLCVKGDGGQTRDLLYVEDCAELIRRAGESSAMEGVIVNGGTGQEIAIGELARLVSSGKSCIEHVPHDHPQAEIRHLVCNAALARESLGWSPTTTLSEGLDRTRCWLEANRWAW